jgi:RHS repeat-associated protein
VVTGIASFLSSQDYNRSKPMASLNWILFDEQFKYVASSSGFDQVGSDEEFKVLGVNELEMAKSGYLFVYLSNASTTQHVYFDNLQVTHVRGPILEETHYYPFGLTMAGISSTALGFGQPENKFKFQGQEFAHGEFSDGSGLEMYEFKYRMDDCQTGRFWQIDPLADKYVYNSTYAFSENKVTGHVELEGLEAWSVNTVTHENGTTALVASVTDLNAPFSVTQGGVTTGFFPNAEMNRKLGGAVVSEDRLLVPVNANGDYNTYTSNIGGVDQGPLGFSFATTDLTPTPTTTANVITPGTPVVLNGERNASTDPVARTATTTVTTGAVNSATPPTVSLMYSDQGVYPNTFTVRDNSSGTNVITPVSGTGGRTTTATNFVSGGTFSVTTTNNVGQMGDGYNFTLTVTPTVSTPTTVPTPAAVAGQWRIKATSRSLKNNVSLY